MKHVEEFLREYWYLMREKRTLIIDLSLAQHAYEQSAERLPSSCRYSVVKSRNRQIAKPVEITAMIMIDEYRATADSLVKHLEEINARIANIEKVVIQAGLDSRQREYIRLRYFKKLSAEAAAQALYCSTSTCRRINRKALEQISKTLHQASLVS